MRTAYFFSLLAGALIAGSASAQDDYPDIRGTWTGVGYDILLNVDGGRPSLVKRRSRR
jgi:hypothetical protein